MGSGISYCPPPNFDASVWLLNSLNRVMIPNDLEFWGLLKQFYGPVEGLTEYGVKKILGMITLFII